MERPLTSLLLLQVIFPSSSLAVDKVVCKPGFAPSQVQFGFNVPPCDPCLEDGVAYPGNNIHLVPSYDVKSAIVCRSKCRQDVRCRYFTFDKENLWCYLKSSKNPGNQALGSKTRYISGSASNLCESDLENEVEVDDDLSDSSDLQKKNIRLTVGSKSGSDDDNDLPMPILSAYHQNGHRTVLSGIPATFGLQIQNDTEVSGVLVQAEDFMCTSPKNLSTKNKDSEKLFAVIRRGVCKFAVKVENAAKSGYKGVVILDNQNNTSVKRISGNKSMLTDSVPVIFLLKKEADILRKLLAENHNMSATIQDSERFSWYRSRPPTITIKTTVMPEDYPVIRFPHHHPNFFLHPGRVKQTLGMKETQQSSTNTQPSMKRENLASRDHSSTSSSKSVQTSKKSLLDMTPLTVGSLVVGVLVFVLLIISVATLIVGKIARRARRRAGHTRCQEAIRQMEARGYSSDQDNPAFSPDESITESPPKPLPRSTYSLLECPVCLELAWPPKKIYQCREGHIVCDVCKGNPNLRNCPMCRIPFATNFTSRNRQLEELARTLKEEDQIGHVMELSNSIFTPSAPELAIEVSSSEGTTETELESSSTEAFVSLEPISESDLTETPVVQNLSAPLVVNLPPEED